MVQAVLLTTVGTVYGVVANQSQLCLRPPKRFSKEGASRVSPRSFVNGAEIWQLHGRLLNPHLGSSSWQVWPPWGPWPLGSRPNSHGSIILLLIFPSSAKYRATYKYYRRQWNWEPRIWWLADGSTSLWKFRSPQWGTAGMSKSRRGTIKHQKRQLPS